MGGGVELQASFRFLFSSHTSGGYSIHIKIRLIRQHNELGCCTTSDPKRSRSMPWKLNPKHHVPRLGCFGFIFLYSCRTRANIFR